MGRPTIRILFEHGEFTAVVGDLTFRVLVADSIALPVYIAIEVITRGLVSLRGTRTPLFTKIGQLVLRIFLISFLLGRIGVVALPAAFAISSTLEALILGTVLFLNLRNKSQQRSSVSLWKGDGHAVF